MFWIASLFPLLWGVPLSSGFVLPPFCADVIVRDRERSSTESCESSWCRKRPSPWIQISSRQSSTTSLTLLYGTNIKQRLEAYQSTTQSKTLLPDHWFPASDINDANIHELHEAAIQFSASLVAPILRFRTKDGTSPIKDDDDQQALLQRSQPDGGNSINNDHNNDNGIVPHTYKEGNHMAFEIVKGRFLDLCGTLHGEQVLERLFTSDVAEAMALERPVVVKGAVVVFQRLLVLGMSYGHIVRPDTVTQSIRLMHEPNDDEQLSQFEGRQQWTADHARVLKYKAVSNDIIKAPGVQLLAALKRRQSSLGAYEVLVRIGAWEQYENLALLRSGVPVRFTTAEEEVAMQACHNEHDPDTILGIRNDYRSQKVYTIDSASTSEIDDGLSVEVISDKEKRYRYWIHIADADRWAPRESELFHLGRRRASSIYLPDRAIPMIPSTISREVMSLRANSDSCAISLGVELADDGSIIDSSLIVAPSMVRVTYRLTYDEVDEMIEDGIAYNEEWELGHLYTIAQKRRAFRFQNGCVEKFISTPLPRYVVSVFPDPTQPDRPKIKVDIEVSHNSGKNLSSVSQDTDKDYAKSSLVDELPASAASTLVTELMILAGEALGKWALRENNTITAVLDDSSERGHNNILQLPYRSQPKPDFSAQSREKKILMDLLEYNVGGGYCQAWYARRFLSPVKVSPFPNPHFCLGLSCYVQWTSPIRRFQDLQAHAAVKRFLRRRKVIELLKHGLSISASIRSIDLGCDIITNQDGKTIGLSLAEADNDIDYNDRAKSTSLIQSIMRQSQKLWMLEYLRRLKERYPGLEMSVVVLGCVDPVKYHYAIFVYDLGLEWKYSSPVSLQAGSKFKVRIGTIAPNNGQLTFDRIHP